MKPLSQIRKESREDFRRKYTDYYLLGSPLSKKDYLTETLSCAESRLLLGIVEKIEGMMKNWPIWGRDTSPAEGDTTDKKNRNEGYNSALSDLKAYIEEGLKNIE